MPSNTLAQGQTPQQQVVLQHQTWQGPLPPPEQLAQFNQIVPGAAERILAMAEEEGRHTRAVQATALQAAVRSQFLGQGFAFLIAIGGMVAAYLLAMHGHDGVASIIAGTTITTIVVAFLQARKQSKSE